MFKNVLNNLKNLSPNSTEFQLKWLLKISEFVNSMEISVQRKILIKIIIDENFALILNDLICSKLNILFTVTKLLCILTEIEEFLLDSYEVLKNILRSIYFLICGNDNNLHHFQPEYIEIIFMLEIIMNRFFISNKFIQNEKHQHAFVLVVKSSLKICEIVLNKTPVWNTTKIVAQNLFQNILIGNQLLGFLLTNSEDNYLFGLCDVGNKFLILLVQLYENESDNCLWLQKILILTGLLFKY